MYDNQCLFESNSYKNKNKELIMYLFSCILMSSYGGSLL